MKIVLIILLTILLIPVMLIIYIVSPPEQQQNNNFVENNDSGNNAAIQRMFEGDKRPAEYEWYEPEQLEDFEAQDLHLSDEQQEWYNNAKANPSKDHSVLFYGTPGTGKTSLARKLARELGLPLVVTDGSRLTSLINEKRTAREKFETTLADIAKKHPGDDDYVLLVEESDQIDDETGATRLRFIKTILEQVDSSKEPTNLWIFSTNHLKDIDEAVYRSGRLNLVEFNWNWAQLKKYGIACGINWPQKYLDIITLPPEKNELISKFSFAKLNGTKPEDRKKSFRTFWQKFQSYTGGENNFDKIELEDLLQFFWDLRGSGDIVNWDGKYTFKRKGSLEEVVNTRLAEINTSISDIKSQAEEIKEELIRGDKQRMDLEELKTDVKSLQNDLINLNKEMKDIWKKINPSSAPSNNRSGIRIIPYQVQGEISSRIGFIEYAISFLLKSISSPTEIKIDLSNNVSGTALFSSKDMPSIILKIQQELDQIKKNMNF